MTPMAKRLAVVLAISLGVNLLLAGVLVGLRGQRFLHRGPPPQASFAAAADKPERGAPRFRQGGMRRAFGEHRQEFKERRQSSAAARNGVRAALEREPFDKAELEKALEALRKETTDSQLLLHRALVETAAAGGQEARRELARDFEFRGRRMK
jgi:uncharacterized membrane protein